MYHIVRHMTERHLARAAVSLLSEAIMYRLLPPLLYHAVDGSRARLHMCHHTLESSRIRLHSRCPEKPVAIAVMHETIYTADPNL